MSKLNLITNSISRSLDRIANIKNIDTKHLRLFNEFGYKDELNFNDFYNAYDRIPHAWAAVHALLDRTWKDSPTIYSNSDSNSKTANKLFKGLWSKIKDADRRQMVGRFSGLIIQYRDSKPWDQPVNSQALSAQKDLGIIGLIPAWEGQLTADSIDDNPQSDTYGKVLTWSYSEGSVIESVTSRTLTIHHDRIIIISEGSEDGNHLSGIPLLKAGFNNLTNLQKVEGAAPESYYKNSARQLMYKPDKEVSAKDFESIARKVTGNQNATMKDYINEITKLLNNGFDSAVAFHGDVSPIQGQVPDPRSTWDINAQSFAASVRVPMRVLFGTESGKLAGDQDGDSFGQTCMQRREWLSSSVITPIIDRLIKSGIIVDDEYNVEWSDLLEPSLSNKLDIITRMSEANNKAYSTGLDIVFDVDEMREIAGYEPLTSTQKGLPLDQ